MRTRLRMVIGIVILVVVFGLAARQTYAPRQAVTTQEPAPADELPINTNTNTRLPETPEQESGDTLPDKPVACTLEAKQCPDGSFVGRTGPNCEFDTCPGEGADSGSGNVVVCSDEMRQVDMCTEQYEPVCGLVEVQCFTEPCDPVPETFSNSCFACSRDNVISYTNGACE